MEPIGEKVIFEEPEIVVSKPQPAILPQELPIPDSLESTIENNI